MNNSLTLYCIRQKGTGCYFPNKSYGQLTYGEAKPSAVAMPRFFSCVKHASLALDHWLLKNIDEDSDNFDIVPVYMTISKLNVEEIADLDEIDRTVKERIRKLGLHSVERRKEQVKDLSAVRRESEK